MSPRSTATIMLAGSLLALSGCAGRPRLDTPPPLTATGWSAPGDGTVPAADADLALLLGSPTLADLIARAQRTSPALLRAETRIDQARALLKLARGAALPSLSIGTNASANSPAGGGPFEFASNFATIDAALSIDFAGGFRAGRRSAGQRVLAARLDRDSLAVRLTAELARTYVTRAVLQARLGLIDRSIEQATQLQNIIEMRRREGVATRVDVGLQKIRVDQLRAERERLRQAHDETRVAIALLVGEEPPAFRAVPESVERFAVPDIAPPPPSRLVATRPDVLAAEARIAAAGGDVRQARAAFFPRLDLSLGRNAQSVLGSGILSGVSLGAELIAPIFNRNRLKGNLELAAAQQRESVQNYREVLLGALADVENGLAAARYARNRALILADVTAEARHTAALARVQYLEGDADLRHLLDAQDLLINAQDAELISRQERLEAAIALYRVSRG
ncbi:TolC family protein [Sphingomonas sp.]|uniref:TolC family protein n=1 Tax=Sphingomonas sp. TaxID=28214 RepID=UPI001DEF6AB1|nr:TolC family protein [Sphingomonas sp.]MBX9796959.1 TolC family protein [Sphingomonas sp.]